MSKLYPERINRDFESRDINERIMSAYDQILMNEGKDEAKAIRDAIKKKFGLTSRDVSVKARYGGTSSAVNVNIKTVKALPYMEKIENIGKGHESYDRDIATGEILSGGNTFIFTNIDYDFKTKLIKNIKTEVDKEIDNLTDDNISTKILGYEVRLIDQATDKYWIPDPKKKNTIGQYVRDSYGIAHRLLTLMIANGDTKNLKKLG